MAHLINDETETAECGRLNAFLRMQQDLNTSQLLKKCLQLGLRNEMRKILKHLVMTANVLTESNLQGSPENTGVLISP
jgi:hypothetical protein